MILVTVAIMLGVFSAILFFNMIFSATASIGANDNNLPKAHTYATYSAVLSGVLWVLSLLSVGFICYVLYKPDSKVGSMVSGFAGKVEQYRQ